MLSTAFAYENETTIRDLQAAYRGAVTAEFRSKTFAAKADGEGFAGVASLFRALARAEQIHAAAQARAIRQLGKAPAATPELFGVSETFRNLHESLERENRTVSEVYPNFLAEAAAELSAMTARQLHWNLEAERTHALLLKEALSLVLGNQRTTWIGSAKDFYVCPVCGSVQMHREGDNCAVCDFPAVRLEAVR